MPWPDLFWKSKKPKPAPERAAEPTPEVAAKPAAPEPQPPTIKPVPASATVTGPNVPVAASVAPTPSPDPKPTPAPEPVKAAPAAESKAIPTIPATHGVVLRPPTGRTVQANAGLPQIQPPRAANPRSTEPLKNIDQLMAEADPVQTLRQTGNLRVLAPLTASIPETQPLNPPPVRDPAAPVKQEPTVRAAAPVIIPPFAAPTPLPTPTIRPAITPTSIAPTPTPTPAPISVPTPIAKVDASATPQTPTAEALATPVPPPEENSPFILKTAPTLPTHDGATQALPTTPPTPSLASSVFRRKARMADVARIVLPPKREDTQQLRPAPTAASENSPTVVPPAFPVAAMTARAPQAVPKIVPTAVVKEVTPVEINPQSKPTPPPFFASAEDSFILKPEKSKSLEAAMAPHNIVETSKTESPLIDQTTDLKAPISNTPAPIIAPTTEVKPIEPLLHTDEPPKVDPEAHKPPPTATPEPKIDPEAHKPEIKPVETKPVEEKPVEAKSVPVETIPTAPPASAAALSSAPTTPEKREFHLANGERVAGTVLSETPEAVYVEHATLGVITIPRTNIAKRLVEIILVNGDRIVGDILAETADSLYVKHASLGMLTVPRAARSTRVVEAILKDGDRILGEVLTETDTFTVIRSASLGTITIPHTKLSMLNRKVEQVEMKSLPPVAELKDKASN